MIQRRKKYISILSFVPNILERCSNKMAQILFNPDISIIMTLLNVSQSSIIYESGTGSGCLSVNIFSVLSKGSGHLYTQRKGRKIKRFIYIFEFRQKNYNNT